MKIETYFIPPKPSIELALNGDCLFCLAHFVQQGDDKYIEFFKNHSENRFVTIDSGVAEGSRVPVQEFLELAKKVNAHEIICPDELWNGLETVRLTQEFLSQVSAEDKARFKFMMVPQGKDIQDFVTSLQHLQELPECGCIGISKFDAPVLFGKPEDIHKVCDSRIRLMDYLVENKLLKKPVHCLGYCNPIEFKHYVDKGYSFVRSCDSASAILCAVHGIRFNKQLGTLAPKPEGGSLYHELMVLPKARELALWNMNIVKELCSNGK